MEIQEIPILDIVAFGAFFGFWLLYSLYADDDSQRRTENLVYGMHKYRLQWIKQMIRREDRLVDIRVVANLVRTTIFLASTSILLVGGLFGILGYGEHAIPVVASIPFAIENSLNMWVIKSIVLMTIFIYSFFKFMWVIRQFNYVTVLMLAAPCHHAGMDTSEQVKKETRYVTKISAMVSNASRHFNMGVRSYYFGLAALSWYVHPVFFAVSGILVVIVLYRREYLSKTLILLS